jgi:oxygen-independent coproporphyrinogen-3 oxidase
VDTVYLGGGTPSLLAPTLLATLFDSIRAEFDLEPEAEITVECAPGQLADSTLAALAFAGVNRVSLGVQSFIDREAAVSGRLHTRADVVEDLQRLRAAGITNLSVDLIAGLAGQTFTSWEESLAILADCGVPHTSVYMLEVDEDSRLGREMLAGGARYHAGLVPKDDAIAQMYSLAIENLGRAGLGQYEISNFCRTGFASRHNLRYWQRRPYLGLGLDASSMLMAEGSERLLELSPADALDTRSFRHLSGENARALRSQPAPIYSPLPADSYVLRSTTTCDLPAFLAGSEQIETAWLSPARQHEEAWFLGLRLNAGVEVAALAQEFGPDMIAPALAAVARLVETDLVAYDGKTVRLTPQGRLLSNDVFQEFLGLGAEERGVGTKARV